MEELNVQSTYSNDQPMTVGQWVGTMLLLAIPLVNIILLFVWAFGSGTNTNKKNYCRATLIIAAVVIAIYVVILLIFGAAMLSSFRQLG